jgi:hypothetical protein
MDLDVTITRTGNDGEYRRIDLSCGTVEGWVHIAHTGNTTFVDAIQEFTWLIDTLLSGANVRTLDHQAFQAWRQSHDAGRGGVNGGASRRWPITDEALNRLMVHVRLQMQRGMTGYSERIDERPQCDRSTVQPPQA